jgi:hypothetical protein
MKRDHLLQPNLRFRLLCLSLLMLCVLDGCQPISSPVIPEMPGITPGKSTEQDVMRVLKEPAKQGPVGVYTLYFYPSPGGNMFIPYEIYFKDSTVRLVIITTMEDNLKSVLAKYGQPEQVTWSGSSPFEWTRLYIFASRGFAVTADAWKSPSAAPLLERWYFEPMSVEQFVKEWRGTAIPTQSYYSNDKGPEDFWNRGP